MEYPATHIASSGHNSNPVTTTTTTTATAASEGEVEELDDKHDIGETFTPYSSQSNGRPHFADSDLLHPLRSSDASLSLHASQRLQSTPLGKQPPKAGLHRVYRTSASTTSPRPITSSVTDSSETGTLANSSVSLSSAEEDDHLAHSVSGRHNINSNNNSFGSRGPLAIRDYWNSLVLDLEGGNVRQPPQSQLPTSSSSQTLGRPAAVESGRVTHAPSTGSSTTLVEQEPASYKQITSSRLSHAHALAPRTTHSPSTVPAFATDHSTHTTSSPSNGDGIGMSRFAAAAAYVEQSYSEERSGSDNRSRSITPQQHSYSYTNEATREGDTEVASRVHDIFRRHIHNASTSYANRRTSSHTLHTSVRSDGNTITTAGQNPRHRLRDLLDRESHLQDESQNNAHATWRGSQASGRHGNANVDSVNSHQGHSSHSRSISRNVSRHGSATPIAGRSRRMSNTSVADDSASGISLKPRKSEERQQQLHEFSASTSISRLSREWRELSARATDRHLQDERSMGLPLDLATTDEEQDELMNDGDIEDHQPEGGSSVRRVTKANVSQSDERSSSRMASEARNRDLDIVQEDLESDDEDLLPSFVDLPSEEEISVEHTTQTPRSRQASRLLSQVSPSPLRTHGSASRSILGEATSHDTHSPTVIHASPSRSRQLFQSPSKPRTPPKTPHLPGHYLSNTPFVSVQPAAKSSLRGTDASRSHAESPDETFAIGTSNISMALPSLPGGYVSPFPHPRRQPTITQEEKVAVTGEQQRLVSPALRKTDRFSTMLQKVIEQREEEAQDTVAGPSTPSQSRFTGSPSRSTRHGIQRSHSPLSSSPLKPEAQPTTRSPIAKSGASPKKTLEGAESSIQAVLVDLARPLKNLLGTFGPTDLSEAASTSMEVHDPLRNAGDLEEDDRQARQVQRKTARSQQDAILKQLRDADQLDQSLSGRLEELKAAFEDMSYKFTTQVTSVLSENFAKEGRRRKMWLFSLLLLELFLVWALFRYADARANLAYQTTYFDPFFPELYDDGNALSSYNSASLDLPARFPFAISPDTAGLNPSKLTAQSSVTTPSSFFHKLDTLFRTSTVPFFQNFIPGVLLPTKIHGSTQYTTESTAITTGPSEVMNHILAILRSFYRQLLSLGLGQTQFVSGTLGGAASSDANGGTGSGTFSWIPPPRDRMYRIPT